MPARQVPSAPTPRQVAELPIQVQDVEAICKQLLRVSQQMLEAGGQANWSALDELDARRLELGRQITAQTVPDAALSECIDQCLKMDAEILTLCKCAQAQVAEELRSVSQGRRIQAAYGRSS